MTNNTTRPVGSGEEGIAAVEADLDSTRHEMADTLDELATRLDVKTRGKQKAQEVKEQAQVAARSRDVQVRAAAAAAAVAGIFLILARRKRRHRSG